MTCRGQLFICMGISPNGRKVPCLQTSATNSVQCVHIAVSKMVMVALQDACISVLPSYLLLDEATAVTAQGQA